jgi:hypothetical protein
MMGAAQSSSATTVERPKPEPLPNVVPFARPFRPPEVLKEAPLPHREEDERGDSPGLDPERLLVNAYTIACNVIPGLDRAGAWVRCAHGPTCPNRACVARLYATEAEARAAVPYFMLEEMRNTFKRFATGREAAENLKSKAPTGRVDFPKYEILRVVGAFAGRDYRRTGCQIDNPFKQLAWGAASDPAWRRVRAHLERFGIYGALLPPAAAEHPLGEAPPASHSSLFVFLSGFEELKVTKVATIPGSIPPPAR